MEDSSQSESPELAFERVETEPGLARLHRVVAGLFSSRSEIAVWTDPNVLIDPNPLAGALAAEPLLAFGFVASRTEHEQQVEWSRIHTQPVTVAVIAVRPDAIRDVSVPDFGPPDLVLDQATGWALAAALTLRGCQGTAVDVPSVRRTVESPESIESLSSVGIAWLIAQSQKWARQTRTNPQVGFGANPTVSALETGAGR